MFDSQLIILASILSFALLRIGLLLNIFLESIKLLFGDIPILVQIIVAEQHICHLLVVAVLLNDVLALVDAFKDMRYLLSSDQTVLIHVVLLEKVVSCFLYGFWVRTDDQIDQEKQQYTFFEEGFSIGHLFDRFIKKDINL